MGDEGVEKKDFSSEYDVLEDMFPEEPEEEYVPRVWARKGELTGLCTKKDGFPIHEGDILAEFVDEGGWEMDLKYWSIVVVRWDEDEEVWEGFDPWNWDALPVDLMPRDELWGSVYENPGAVGLDGNGEPLDSPLDEEDEHDALVREILGRKGNHRPRGVIEWQEKKRQEREDAESGRA